MNRLIIYGLGDFAKTMRYYFAKDTDYTVVAFCADKNYINQDELDGLPVVPFENIENIYGNDEYKMFVAVGYSRMRARKLMYEKARNKQYEMASYISPLANVDPQLSNPAAMSRNTPRPKPTNVTILSNVIRFIFSLPWPRR